jgi:tetratricopeptide (TPR) repeat protein
MAAASEEYRNREIRRLLALLSDDPDKGLQFALPLHALVTRGKAAPTNRLPRHATNFNLSEVMGGNRAGDPWNFSAEMQRQLRTKYLESANRELNLGRFQRAAYIFAYLLGDYASAADALKRGRYYREAAILYKERLHNPSAAASCLVQGGLLSEAILIYKDLRLYETAGDLHARLDQMDKANECYVAAAAYLTEHSEFLAAAKLWETKLASPQTAMELLDKTWPEKDASGANLREWFALVGRMGGHELAQERVQKLCADPLPARSGLTLVQILSQTARDYPNPAVRSRAADSTRVLVGHRLTDENTPEHAALVRALTSLAPGDHLLRRDGARFLEPAKLRPASRPIPLKDDGPRLSYHFRLPSICRQWQSVVKVPGGVLAVGSSDDQIALARRRWDGAISEHTRRLVQSDQQPLLLMPPGSKDPALLTVISGEGAALPIENLNLGPGSLFENDLLVQTPPYLTGAVLGACRDEFDTVWVLKGTHAENVSLVGHGEGGKVLASYHPNFTPNIEFKPITAMTTRMGSVYVAMDRTVVQIRGGHAVDWALLPWSIRSFAGSLSPTGNRLLVAMDNGAAVVWNDGSYHLIAQDLIHPVATFTPEGLIVVVGSGRGQIYKSAGLKVEFVATFQVLDEPPIAVLPASRGEFAVFYADGRGDIFRIS